MTTPTAQEIYNQWALEGVTREFSALNAEQQAQAVEMFRGEKMEQHTYSLRPDGSVHQWRFFKPSDFCLAAIELVMKGD